MQPDDVFSPESVDEQIEQWTSFSSLETLPPGWEVIPRLSRLYQADQQSTQRVWKQLARHLVEHDATLQSASKPVEAIPEGPIASRSERQLASRFFRHTGSSWLAQVAAILVAALIVGSLLVVLQLTRSSRMTQLATALPSTPAGLYFSRSDGVYRLNIQTRKVIWHTHLAGHYPFAGMASLIGDTVYITSGGTLSALDASTGALHWSRDFKQSVLFPSLADGLLYVNVSLGHTLYAVNPAHGTITATYMPKQGFWNTPTVVKGVLYYTAGSSLYAVQLSGEKLLWQQQVSTHPLPMIGFSVHNGVVYASVMQFMQKIQDTVGLIDAFDAQTGRKLWQSPAMSRGVRIVTFTNEMLYAAAFGRLLAFDVHTHALVWQQSFNTGQMLVAAGVLYLGQNTAGSDHEGFAALNAATGKLLWQKTNYSGGGAILAGVRDGRVYGTFWTGQGVGTIYALNADDGAQLWTMPTGATFLQWGGMAVA